MLTRIIPWLIVILIAGCSKPDTQRFASEDVKRVQYGNRLPNIKSAGIDPAGFTRANYLKSSEKVLKHVQNGDIQIVNEGHRLTLVLPTDKYFRFDTATLNEFKAPVLENIAELVKCFPYATIYVAGFTDNVGSYDYKKSLSQQRAQAVVAYLWSHGVNERRIEAEGYGDKFAHANNNLIHGSALNRRVEVQWTIH